MRDDGAVNNTSPDLKLYYALELLVLIGYLWTNII